MPSWELQDRTRATVHCRGSQAFAVKFYEAGRQGQEWSAIYSSELKTAWHDEKCAMPCNEIAARLIGVPLASARCTNLAQVD